MVNAGCVGGHVREKVKYDKVLIITGGATVGGSMMSNDSNSTLSAVGRQLGILRASSAIWQDLSLKAVSAELLTAKSLFMRGAKFKKKTYQEPVRRYYSAPSYIGSPELTEIVLASALLEEGLTYEATTFAALTDPKLRNSLLDQCGCVLVSSTLMRDMSEMAPLVQLLKRDNNKVVVGGALVSLLHSEWTHLPGADLVAIGYGEMLIPEIASWIKSGYTQLDSPEKGRIVDICENTLIYSGSPESKNLDWLPTPNWEQAEKYHGKKFELINYESVRGCPYRCAFCNFPFLFEDTVFRTKSAQKIFDDWMIYARNGAKIINCMDSLFTIPPKRLRTLCDLLIKAGSPIGWTCYARAGDLAKPGTAALMKAAGCKLVHIGYESGSQTILDNMNKRSGVQSNVDALRLCREAELTSAVTLIVGFPGETKATVKETYERLKESPPDLFFGGGFNTRMVAMPVLQPEPRKKYGLVTQSDHMSSAPYWRHDTMSCHEVPKWLRWLNQKLIEDRVALEGSLFYSGLMGYQHADRGDLLDFQYDILQSLGALRPGFGMAHRTLRGILRVDINRKLALRSGAPRPLPTETEVVSGDRLFEPPPRDRTIH